MKNFRAYQLAVLLYKESQRLKFKGVLKDQFERAVLSIVLKLSEGSSRPSSKERKRFYTIALGSCREVQTILELQDRHEEYKKADNLAAHLYKLCHSS